MTVFRGVLYALGAELVVSLVTAAVVWWAVS